MKTVNVLVLKTAGTNCDAETAYAFKRAGATADIIHINKFLHNEDDLMRYHILALPGGFSYGDDIASGKILANELRFKLEKKLKAFTDSGRLIIGICNGFQVLVKANLLPGLGADRQTVTLTNNDSGKFESRWISLAPNPASPCIFTKGITQSIPLPVAHGEGKFIAADASVLKTIEEKNMVVFRYCGGDGAPTETYPANPNGSANAIAGVCDPTGRIFGLMPHPERFVAFRQHPQWTRLQLAEEGAGLQIFRNAVSFAKDNLL